MAKKGILERLKDGVVLGDGGYLLELEKRGWVQAGPFTPEVVLMRPQAVKELHMEFKTAGAEVLQALTFYASRDKLGTVGLADKLGVKPLLIYANYVLDNWALMDPKGPVALGNIRMVQKFLGGRDEAFLNLLEVRRQQQPVEAFRNPVERPGEWIALERSDDQAAALLARVERVVRVAEDRQLDRA